MFSLKAGKTPLLRNPGVRNDVTELAPCFRLLNNFRWLFYKCFHYPFTAMWSEQHYGGCIPGCTEHPPTCHYYPKPVLFMFIAVTATGLLR